jgi:hypothetical protein
VQGDLQLMKINVSRETEMGSQLLGVHDLHGPAAPFALPVQTRGVENADGGFLA